LKKILVTGFEPFDGSPVNPSQQVALGVNEQIIGGYSIVTAILPVDRLGGPQALLQAIDKFHPHAVLCLGEAARRPGVSIERIAVNLMDYRIPDNQGEQITDLPIVQDGPAAYFSTLPVREMYNAIQAAGIPVELSLSAGAFLCNQVFYTGLDFVSKMADPIPLGFIHLPALPEQAARAPAPYASMNLETSQHAIRLALDVLVEKL
jgi:pyroglutamyl-peptidase